jgi:D-amino peptidase
MKIFVMTDLEGVAGVQRWVQTREEGAQNHQAIRLLTAEVNAAVDGILDAAPEADIVVWDGHGSGAVDVEHLHAGAHFIPRGPIAPPYFLDEGFDALFFVGQHAMAGTRDAPLSHTYSSQSIEHYKLNGILMGEFGCRAALAGSLGIPAVFISGDDKVVAEARALVPGIYGATVKQGRGIELAIHLSPPAARLLIRQVAGEAVRHIADIPPFVLQPPYELEIRLLENVDTGRYRYQMGVEQLADRTFVFRSQRLSDLHI